MQNNDDLLVESRSLCDSDTDTGMKIVLLPAKHRNNFSGIASLVYKLLHTTQLTRHRASTSMYSLTFRARITTPTVWTKWDGLIADNVAHAAGTSILSLARRVFAGMRSAGSVQWASRITAGLCHAFLALP